MATTESVNHTDTFSVTQWGRRVSRTMQRFALAVRDIFVDVGLLKPPDPEPDYSFPITSGASHWFLFLSRSQGSCNWHCGLNDITC